MIKILYMIAGFFFLGLGILGIVLPILPTTPFLLLTAFFFAKGSQRFHIWFTHTKIYKKYLESFVKDRTMTRKQKWTLMFFVDTLLIITMFYLNQVWLYVMISIIIVAKHYYFHTQVIIK